MLNVDYKRIAAILYLYLILFHHVKPSQVCGSFCIVNVKLKTTAWSTSLKHGVRSGQINTERMSWSLTVRAYIQLAVLPSRVLPAGRSGEGEVVIPLGDGPIGWGLCDNGKPFIGRKGNGPRVTYLSKGMRDNIKSCITIIGIRYSVRESPSVETSIGMDGYCH